MILALTPLFFSIFIPFYQCECIWYKLLVINLTISSILYHYSCSYNTSLIKYTFLYDIISINMVCLYYYLDDIGISVLLSIVCYNRYLSHLIYILVICYSSYINGYHILYINAISILAILYNMGSDHEWFPIQKIVWHISAGIYLYYSSNKYIS